MCGRDDHKVSAVVEGEKSWGESTKLIHRHALFVGVQTPLWQFVLIITLCVAQYNSTTSYAIAYLMIHD